MVDHRFTGYILAIALPLVFALLIQLISIRDIGKIIVSKS